MKPALDARTLITGGGTRLAASALLLAGGLAWAQAPLPKDSPFLPADATSATSPGETLEFAGVSVVGNRTDLIFHDKATKKTSWVRLGATANGISALKYDAKLEQAVVRVNGTEKVLTLRKGSGPLNAPMPPPPAVPANATVQILPAPAPTGPTNAAQIIPPAPPTSGAAPVAPGSPEAIAKQETEARMLVSDLLEIGMAQRKAYEEAQQRKAAEQNGLITPGNPPAIPPATPPLPVTPPPAPPPPQPPPQQN